MSRRTYNAPMRFFVGILAVVVVAGLVAPVSGGSASSVVNLRFVSVTTWTKHHDLAPQGDSRGDWQAARDNLRNAVPQFGKPVKALVGTDAATMTLVRIVGLKYTFRVKGVAHLPGGTVSFGGRFTTTFQAPITVAVTGGTGRFAGARGTTTNHPGKSTINTFHLLLP
jgi:hypothetical protein